MSLGDHALHGRSEGRYASVSAAMARGGDWMAPEFLGQPHLTKPPMVYWLEAESMLWFGQNEFAVRFPAASGR